MSEWKESKIIDLCEKIVDCVNRTAPTVDYTTQYKMIRTTNVRNGKIDSVNVRYVTEETYKTWIRRGKPQVDDIVLTREAPVGEVGRITVSDFLFLGQRTMMYRADKQKIHPHFLFYTFFTKDFKDQVFSTGMGSVVEHIRVPDAKDFIIKYPIRIQEQTAIASVLSSLDDKIDLLHRQNATLEKMAETLFRQWFVEEAKEEWDYQLTLGDLIDSVSITHKFPNPSVVFLNTSDIHLGNVIEHNPSTVKDLPGQAKKTIRKDDILFSEIRPANGRWAYIDFEAENYVVSTKLMVLRSKNVLSQAFIYFYLINPATVEWLQMIAESRSGTFPQITFDQIRDLKINVPSEKILQDSIIWSESTLKKIKFNQTQIRTLTTLRDTLLPKLMSGEVRVIT